MRTLVVLLLLAVTHADADGLAVTPPQFVVARIAPHTGGVPEDQVARTRELLSRIELRLPHVVTVVYRDCGTANAFYSAETRTISICHELWNERRALYLASGHDANAIATRLRDAMAFTVFHELAHALHAELELPLVGRIEDAADEIATMLLISIGAPEIAEHAAYGHHLRSLATSRHAFWDEHASGAQRGFAIACLLYGADPVRTSPLVTWMHAPTSRIARCVSEHARRVETWRRLFGLRTRGAG
jgi:putative metallopeptidase DUF4344